MRPPSSCASNFPTCSGSSTAQDHSMTRVLRLAVCCLPPSVTASASRIVHFAAQWLACRCPLSTLRYTPRDAQRMTRGQDGSLLLPCVGLSPTITCQFVLAHYASHPSVTRRMATLATGLPATALTGLDFHQLDSYKEFHCLITDSPSPRFSQRDLLRPRR